MIQQRKVSNKERRFLELARRQAIQSPYLLQKHGAVLVRGGNVLNASFNSACFNAFAQRFVDIRKKKRKYPSRHAEIAAILNLDHSVTSGATIYVVRVTTDGTKFCMSKPCEMCVDTMTFVGIKKVIYTVNETEIAEMRL